MKNKCVTAMVAINLSVAFDMVDHDILFNTLHCNLGTSKMPLNGYIPILGQDLVRSI